MKKILSLVAVVLALATCLSVSVFAAEKIAVTGAHVDTVYNNKPARPEACIDTLRNADDLWFNCSVLYDPSEDSIAGPGERYLTLALGETADIETLKIQWYQGGSSQTDAATGNKERKYEFRIEASADATGDNFTQVYPASGTATSGTGNDFEEYACNFADAKRIRIWGYGNDGGVEATGTVNVAIRNIEVYGTGKGGPGGVVDQNDPIPGPTTPRNPNPAPGTGDNVAKLLTLAGVAIVSGVAVVVIRKKIRER